MGVSVYLLKIFQSCSWINWKLFNTSKISAAVRHKATAFLLAPNFRQIEAEMLLKFPSVFYLPRGCQRRWCFTCCNSSLVRSFWGALGAWDVCRGCPLFSIYLLLDACGDKTYRGACSVPLDMSKLKGDRVWARHPNFWLPPPHLIAILLPGSGLASSQGLSPGSMEKTTLQPTQSPQGVPSGSATSCTLIRPHAYPGVCNTSLQLHAIKTSLLWVATPPLDYVRAFEQKNTLKE